MRRIQGLHLGIGQWVARSAPKHLLALERPLLGVGCLLVAHRAEREMDLLRSVQGFVESRFGSSNVAWGEIEDASVQSSAWQRQCLLWSPQRVLVLGEQMAQCLLQMPDSIDHLRTKPWRLLPQLLTVQITYDMRHCQQHPLDKAALYRDLCQL